MSENIVESDINSGATGSIKTEGVLEDSEGVDVEVKIFSTKPTNKSLPEAQSIQIHVATLKVGFAQHLIIRDRLKLRMHENVNLYWSHAGILRLLQNMSPQQILGNNFVLLAGKHLPITDPRPGMINVCIAEVLENPNKLSSQEIFVAAHSI